MTVYDERGAYGVFMTDVVELFPRFKEQGGEVLLAITIVENGRLFGPIQAMKYLTGHRSKTSTTLAMRQPCGWVVRVQLRAPVSAPPTKGGA
jgi:hypothetical protein